MAEEDATVAVTPMAVTSMATVVVGMVTKAEVATQANAVAMVVEGMVTKVEVATQAKTVAVPVVGR